MFFVPPGNKSPERFDLFLPGGIYPGKVFQQKIPEFFEPGKEKRSKRKNLLIAFAARYGYISAVAGGGIGRSLLFIE